MGRCFTTLAAYELAEEGINWWFRWTLDSCGQWCTDHIYLESDKISCVWLSYPDALQTEPQPSEPKFDSSHQTRLESQILGDCSSSPAGGSTTHLSMTPHWLPSYLMEDAFTRWSTQSLTPDRQWTRLEKPKIRFCALPGGSPIFREWHRSTMADSPPIRWKMLSHGGWLFCRWATAHPNPGVTFISEDIRLMARMMITMVLVTFTQTQGWLSYLMGDRGSIRWPILRFNGWRSHANFDGDDDDDDDGDSSVQWVTVPRQLWSQPISVMLRTTANIYIQKRIL